jgi:hypothetical protein
MSMKIFTDIFGNQTCDLPPSSAVPQPTAPLCAHSFISFYINVCIGFGGLEVACWPLVPKFTGSNPAEAVGFLRAKKSSARHPSEGK